MTIPEQEAIGAVAVALGATFLGIEQAEDDRAEQGHSVALLESGELLKSLVQVSVLRDDAGTVPLVPDLRPFGIRQCAGCGCTDNHGCPEGCGWVSDDVDLCTSCALVAPGGAP